MKVILAGSPDISIEAFEEVIKNFDVVAIITQPDKRKGRGMNLESTPVAKLGDKYNILTFKPQKISEIKDEIEALNFDIFLTFAFGQWVPEKILNLGKFKPINIHGSLLPKYRGAAPIHHAILNGDKEIGITLIEMIKEMDAGDMFFQASKEINENTTTGEAFKIISDLARDNIVSWLKKINKGLVNPQKQPKDFTTSPKIDKSFGYLEKISKKEARRRVRGLNPFPGAFVIINKKRLKVFDVSDKKIPNSIELNFHDGNLYATDYQWESKKRVIL